MTSKTSKAEAKREAALANMSTIHLRCRYLHGHPFQLVEKVPDGHAFGTLMVWKCDCGMIRHDVINILGAVAYRRYFPPENYTVPKELRPTAAQMRLEYLNRV